MCIKLLNKIIKRKVNIDGSIKYIKYKLYQCLTELNQYLLLQQTKYEDIVLQLGKFNKVITGKFVYK